MKLLLVCGGQSTEHSVSRMSCTNIRKKIDDTRYEVTVLGIDQEGTWYHLDDEVKDYASDNWLNNAKEVKEIFDFLRSFDVIFPVLHGMYGEDGTIQGLFEMAGVPYVGCRVNDSANAMDKVITKKLIDAAGIKQVPSLYVKKRFDDEFVIVNDDTTEEKDIVKKVMDTFGVPCFIKASRSGSSVGCYKVNKEEDILPKLKEAGQYDRKILIEKSINATELECAVLGNDDIISSRVGQILPHGEFYTFESKYEDEESATCIPARVDQSIQDTIRKEAVRAFKAIDGHGLARCDFFLDKDTGDLYLNELNTLPGFTNISMYPQLMEDFGISQEELINRLIELALER
jgi:D-alanine-D-alanine ligase